MSSGLLEDASFNQSPASATSTCSAPTGRWRRRRSAPASTSPASACGRTMAPPIRSISPGRQRESAQAHTMDARGNRIDFVEFHPAYHALMAKSIGHRHSRLPAHDGSDKKAPVSTRAVRPISPRPKPPCALSP
jgi:putative acyl-CoA dehydrogenase